MVNRRATILYIHIQTNNNIINHFRKDKVMCPPKSYLKLNSDLLLLLLPFPHDLLYFDHIGIHSKHSKQDFISH